MKEKIIKAWESDCASLRAELIFEEIPNKVSEELSLIVFDLKEEIKKLSTNEDDIKYIESQQKYYAFKKWSRILKKEIIFFQNVDILLKEKYETK